MDWSATERRMVLPVLLTVIFDEPEIDKLPELPLRDITLGSLDCVGKSATDSIIVLPVFDTVMFVDAEMLKLPDEPFNEITLGSED